MPTVAGVPAVTAPAADLEPALTLVEQKLGALGAALSSGDPAAIEREAIELQRALAGAVECFSRAARGPGAPLELRRRLAIASARVAAQRESLARATAALDRAIDVLLPAELPSRLYSAAGGNDRPPRIGTVQA